VTICTLGTRRDGAAALQAPISLEDEDAAIRRDQNALGTLGCLGDDRGGTSVCRPSQKVDACGSTPA
jgi:hypothetical protein